ncbi:MAG: hypothetical protein IKI09_05540 [Bacteroidales bacterium]|nr:hypothetical protein [Bacteroidales bacterium]
MRKHLIIIALAVFMPLMAAAQYGRQSNAIIAHVGGGWGGFPGRSSATRIDHFMGALGADLKLPMTGNWSLLVGLDYQFRFIKSGYNTYNGSTSYSHSTFLNGHYLRLPVRMEYDYNWFYVAAGPYLEKGFGNMPARNEMGILGLNLELGTRFEINRYDHLRIGLLNSFGAVFDNKMRMNYTELNFVLRVGYEHQF